MSITLLGLSDFQLLFTGNTEAYGQHIYKYSDKGKKEKGDNYTKISKVTDTLYRDHLEGKKGLGIVPIDRNNNCRFAAIDIDVYNKDIKNYIDFIHGNNLPVFPFRSKSGGLHLYVFFEKFMKVNKVKYFMEVFKLILMLGINTEIFPKQSALVEGQAGNWINLPYYNAYKTQQYMYDNKQEPIGFDLALDLIKDNLQTEEKLTEFFSNLPLSDGPPCLQSIHLWRTTDFRNEYLFSLARYYKTKFGDDFEYKLIEANALLDKPIDISRLQRTVISSNKKKDYTYKCSGEPLVSLCNKNICKSRAYGIGGEEISELTYEEFIKYESDPPYYEWKVNGEILRFFSEKDIISQIQFRILCFRHLHLLPIKIKEMNWSHIINRALENVIIKKINAEEDVSTGSLFKEYMSEFLEKRAPADNREQVMIDRVYKDKDKSVYVFKPKNLINFLFYQKQFRNYMPTVIHAKVRELGGVPVRFRIDKNVTTRVWELPFKALGMFIEEKSVDDFKIDFKEEYEDEAF